MGMWAMTGGAKLVDTDPKAGTVVVVFPDPGPRYAAYPRYQLARTWPATNSTDLMPSDALYAPCVLLGRERD